MIVLSKFQRVPNFAAAFGTIRNESMRKKHRKNDQFRSHLFAQILRNALKLDLTVKAIDNQDCPFCAAPREAVLILRYLDG